MVGEGVLLVGEGVLLVGEGVLLVGEGVLLVGAGVNPPHCHSPSLAVCLRTAVSRLTLLSTFVLSTD